MTNREMKNERIAHSTHGTTIPQKTKWEAERIRQLLGGPASDPLADRRAGRTDRPASAAPTGQHDQRRAPRHFRTGSAGGSDATLSREW
jgi:hypothetical protein